MDFSDSDDDLLPNMNTFTDMFSKVADQARRPDPVASKAKSSSKKPKKKSSQEKKASKSSQDRADKSKREKENGETEFSDSTKHLLEELGQISAPVILPFLASSSSNPISLGSNTLEAEGRTTRSRAKSLSPPPVTAGRQTKRKTTKARGGGRGRGRKKTAEVIEILEDDYPFEESINIEDIMEIEPIPIVEECSLRIRWKQEMLRFKKPKNTKMAEVRNDVSIKVGIRADNVVILDDETSEEISDNALVDTIPFGKVLEAFERESSTSTTVNPKNLDPDQIIIKLQGRAGYRERYATTIKKTTHVKQLIDDFIEKYRYHGKKFKLVFDGEDLDLSETPESLDMENNDMIDVVEIV